MRLWQDGLIALLAAIGLTSIIWTLICAVVFSPVRRQRSVVLICARGDGSDLEDQVNTLLFLRRRSGTVDEIILMDCGLTEEGQKICRLLSQKHHLISLCTKDEIDRHIT